ncbi:hypothetical protein TTHERM_001550956 (macronuclear) [Tetrahymena thermophila SB210]|uniref:Uncharacterized protein n=1 Tax=Tetrahymena thermophila (strain SB210) TaxID=312017 RepID=W7XL38_TETTS|nr:hypothetical protein TTHERM_001550956 [Tetrahymena thermophila SB210]EWS75614.1 hypothetical protein TTHERM_001550956 [Tetrahymena thermophila SB210]|eukprot:XP_012651852.1 hypothetical protein TTHERM_001550956 [Tetrahymena thermophila SB210]
MLRTFFKSSFLFQNIRIVLTPIKLEDKVCFYKGLIQSIQTMSINYKKVKRTPLKNVSNNLYIAFECNFEQLYLALKRLNMSLNIFYLEQLRSEQVEFRRIKQNSIFIKCKVKSIQKMNILYYKIVKMLE